ncbi:MAG: hypothetical protein A2201_09165 [Alicyclobacillus sp. RIFOXYA1_FULL_53_8]|nr:MAG: hypothetical protein A2201_09165 [Alicyclobacillus sp. RIFOXYA1_FULL_53_8]
MSDEQNKDTLTQTQAENPAETGTLSEKAADTAAASTTSETATPEKAKPTPAAKPAAAQAPADPKPATPEAPTEAKPATPEAAPADPKPATPEATAAAKPAPAKKAPPPPDPRALAAKEIAEKLKQSLVSALGEASVEETGAAHFKPMVRIRKEDWATAVELLRTHPEWKLNYLELMAGTDYKDYIEVVIYLQSIELGHFLCLKTRTDREEAKLPSLVSSHAGVNWEEREIYDLLGVNFTNHPDLRRIMMWDEFKGHPLRKDYSEWD